MASDEAVERKVSVVIMAVIDCAARRPEAFSGADKHTASNSLAFLGELSITETGF
jgi:hypothetical protein